MLHSGGNRITGVNRHIMIIIMKDVRPSLNKFYVLSRCLIFGAFDEFSAGFDILPGEIVGRPDARRAPASNT